jgi:predicted alpha/beta superfamily hydrolase
MNRVACVLIAFMAVMAGCVTNGTEPTESPGPEQHAPGVFYSYAVGDYYEIYVALPEDYDEKGPQYPVIYLLDADWYFDGSNTRIPAGGVEKIVSRLAENGDIPDVILVGIGYCHGENNRGRDFLLSYTHFYKFLKDELIPFIDKAYNTSSEGRTLIGHSDGGFFTMYAFFQYGLHSPVFENFVAISGDFTKVGRCLFSEESYMYQRMKNGVLDVWLYMAVGEYEEDRFVTSNREMAERLRTREYAGFHIVSKKYRGLNHGSIVAPAIEDGLKWIFKGTESLTYYWSTLSRIGVPKGLYLAQQRERTVFSG